MGRRTEIIAATITSIGQEGLQRTNPHSLAKRLGIRPSNVSYHFPQMADLLEATVEWIVEVNQTIVNPRMAKARTRIDEVHAYMEGNLEWVRKHPDQYAVLLTGFMEAGRGGELGATVQNAIAGGGERLYGIITKGVVEGEFATISEPREVAEILHHQLVGTLTRFYTDRARTAVVYRNRLKRVVDDMLAV